MRWGLREAMLVRFGQGRKPESASVQVLGGATELVGFGLRPGDAFAVHVSSRARVKGDRSSVTVALTLEEAEWLVRELNEQIEAERGRGFRG